MDIQEILGKNYVDSSEAAKMLNLSIISIRALCQRGRFNGAFKFGNSWIIPRDSVRNRTKLKAGARPRNTQNFIRDILRKNQATNIHLET